MCHDSNITNIKSRDSRSLRNLVAISQRYCWPLLTLKNRLYACSQSEGKWLTWLVNKQLKNCKLSRNSRAKKDTPTRVVGIITVKIHPTVYLQATGFYEKCVGVHASCPYHSCLFTFSTSFCNFFSYFYRRHLRHLSPDASHDCVSCFDGYTCLLILILAKTLLCMLYLATRDYYAWWPGAWVMHLATGTGIPCVPRRGSGTVAIFGALFWSCTYCIKMAFNNEPSNRMHWETSIGMFEA